MRQLVPVTFVMTILCSVTAAAVAQAIYKWTDATGVTHYSEQAPPVAVKTKQLLLNAAVSASTPATSAPPLSQSTATALDAAKSDYRKQACTTARGNLKLLSGRGMVLDTGTMQNPAGVDGARMLGSEQRDAARSDAQQQIQQFCDRG